MKQSIYSTGKLIEFAHLLSSYAILSLDLLKLSSYLSMVEKVVFFFIWG